MPHELLGDIRWRHSGAPMMPPQTLKTTLAPILGEGEDAKGRALLLRCVPFFDAGNEHAGWMVSLVDITQMRRAQSQRDEALRFISHDIREPSAAILTIIELARVHPDAITSGADADAHRAPRPHRPCSGRWLRQSGAGPRAQPFRAEVLDLVALGLQSIGRQLGGRQGTRGAPARRQRAGRSAVHRRPQPDHARARQHHEQRHQVFGAGAAKCIAASRHGRADGP